MSSPTAKACRLKTAIAEEVGNIQGMAERYIAESNDYLINRVPQGTFDNRQGEKPRKVRYSTAPVPDTEYQDMLVNGNQDEAMPTRDDCTGDPTEIDTITDKRGAFGCNMPGETISGGYDEFFRVLKGKAWETEPFCALDLILKEHYNEYIDMLRRDLPRRAMEQFGYSLERNVIDFGYYNTSVVDGFTTARGVFPAKPEGTLDVFTIRRVFAILAAQGWVGPREIGPISHTAFETMRANYKAKEGVELNSTLAADDTRFLGTDVTVVDWAGFRWILSDKPLRGYLLPRVGGGFSFVPVRPTRARAGTGEGIVTDVNEEYFDCRTICNGQELELYEVAFYVHPTASTREGFAMPQVGGKSFSNQMFNFEVRMIDGAYLECNEDNLKAYFRMLHAYAFESIYPERMGAIIYRVSPDCVNVVSPCCDDACPPDGNEPVEIDKPDAPRHDRCSEDNCADECPEERGPTIAPEPTEDEPCPEPDEGVIALGSCGPVVTDTEQGEVCVYVERRGGSLGAASVQFDTADDTALAGVDYTAVAGLVLNWADGENDTKKVCIPILETGAGDVAFDVVLSNAVGADLADDATTGCSTAQVQINAPCDAPPVEGPPPGP